MLTDPFSDFLRVNIPTAERYPFPWLISGCHGQVIPMAFARLTPISKNPFKSQLKVNPFFYDSIPLERRRNGEYSYTKIIF